ncbi:hypothetical protein CAL26_09770 [Bordetella genomosp. 9]|uniref:Uncharacterized protein n=1 Tax=Bordetella genomosp. 9 TaxID=1416803 RepID=A0A261RFA7_9BORD|nr:hypothetical protein [Bordetella genomosp. 9]OZI23709.1 hypothetical protein CAL26_09770 [Bordetella genomosp. 9]
MDDRELLERAARAAGKEFDPTSRDKRGLWVVKENTLYHQRELWNPLTNDGDAFRLAVALSLFDDLEHKASAYASERNYDIDPCKAFRHVITNAAAARGR